MTILSAFLSTLPREFSHLFLLGIALLGNLGSLAGLKVLGLLKCTVVLTFFTLVPCVPFTTFFCTFSAFRTCLAGAAALPSLDLSSPSATAFLSAAGAFLGGVLGLQLRSGRR